MAAKESQEFIDKVLLKFEALNQLKEADTIIKGFPTESVAVKLIFINEEVEKNYTLVLRFDNNLHFMSKSYYYKIDMKILKSKSVTERAIESENALFQCEKFRHDKRIVFKMDLDYDSLYFLLDMPFYVTIDIKRMYTDAIIDQGALNNSTIDWFKDMFMADSGDIKIKVGSAVFTAHRVILSARSDVFKAMLNHEMKEKEANEIKMEYFEADVFKQFLWYLYTGEIKDLNTSSVLELYKIADMYQVNTLKKQCMEFIIFNVTMDSTVSFLGFADLFQMKDFKEDLLNFVSLFERTFVRRDDFKKYLIDNLSIDTVAYVLKMIGKHKKHLDDLKLPVFQYIKENHADIVKNEKFLNLFEAYSSLMREIFVFILAKE